MKKLSKILLIVASLALVLTTLTGCGTNTDNNTTNNGGSTATKDVIARGEIDANNVYRSEYAGITFKLPEGYTYADDQEIAEMMNVGVEALSEKRDNVKELIEQNGLYDMVAKNSNGESVMVMFEKATLNLTEEAYLKNVKTGLEATQMGYESSGEIKTEKVGGREYKSLVVTIPSYKLTQKYYTQKIDGYFVSILVTYFESTTNLDTLIANFQ